MSVSVVQAKRDLLDALNEMELQASWVLSTLAPRDVTAAALDVLEGELGRKMALVRECAEALRGAVEALDSREIGESAFPRRRT